MQPVSTSFGFRRYRRLDCRIIKIVGRFKMGEIEMADRDLELGAWRMNTNCLVKEFRLEGVLKWS